MSDTAAKVITSAIVWLAFTIVSAGVLLNSDKLGGGSVVIIMTLLGIAAAASTGFIWQTQSETAAESAEKAKRRGKLDRVLEKLNDQDIEELRVRLMAESDGERASLDELMRR